MAALSHDSALVRVPVVGIQAHGQRAGGKHIVGHIRLAADRGVSINVNFVLGGIRVAHAGDAVGGGVRIVGVGLETTGTLHVVIGVLGPAATAAVRGLVTLRDLLGGEQGVGGLAQSTDGVRLDLLGGGERPAAAAIALTRR